MSMNKDIKSFISILVWLSLLFLTGYHHALSLSDEMIYEELFFITKDGGHQILGIDDDAIFAR
jgi:hypothetical protein